MSTSKTELLVADANESSHCWICQRERDLRPLSVIVSVKEALAHHAAELIP